MAKCVFILITDKFAIKTTNGNAGKGSDKHIWKPYIGLKDFAFPFQSFLTKGPSLMILFRLILFNDDHQINHCLSMSMHMLILVSIALIC